MGARPFNAQFLTIKTKNMYNHKPVDTYSIFKISMTHERFNALDTRLGHKIEVLERDDDFTTFELRVESSIDLLNLFHSGVDYAMKKHLFDKIK